MKAAIFCSHNELLAGIVNLIDNGYDDQMKTEFWLNQYFSEYRRRFPDFPESITVAELDRLRTMLGLDKS
jgi:hypothetical protein